MLFNTVQFAVFLGVVVALFRLLRTAPAQNALLLAASYVFYAAWDWRFLSLLWVSTITDFVVGRRLAGTDDRRSRRRLLAVSVVVNIGMLGAFKYFDFFTDSAARLLEGLGFQADWPTLGIVLPVGISFYTFQTLSYTIDVFRRDMDATDDLLTFAVFVAFFPQLVAGPIERARRLIPQFLVPRRVPGGERLASALHLLGLGLFKKVVIADAVAPHVDRAFEHAGSAGWVTLLVGIVGFSLQIYGDFSGYTDMARGAGRLFGIELMENFHQPYLSRNITEFWRTWHISLSTWLRDYLYIPLGGNRRGGVFTARNLMLTMLIGGLWHGAAWTFVAWGGIHGVLLAAHRPIRGQRSASATGRVPRWSEVPSVMATFGWVALAWIFFRAPSFGDAWDYLSGIVTLRGGAVDRTAVWLVIPALVVVLIIDVAQRAAGTHVALSRWPALARGLAYGAAAGAVIIFSGSAPIPFIYFQF